MTNCTTRPAPLHAPVETPQHTGGPWPSDVPSPLRVRHDHVHGDNGNAVCTRCAGAWRIDTIHGSWLVDLDRRLLVNLADPNQPTLTLLRLALTQLGRPLTFSVMAWPCDDYSALVETRTAGTVTGLTRLRVPMTTARRHPDRDLAPSSGEPFQRIDVRDSRRRRVLSALSAVRALGIHNLKQLLEE